MTIIHTIVERALVLVVLCLPLAGWAQMAFHDRKILSMTYEEEASSTQRGPNDPPTAVAPPSLGGCRLPVRKMEDIRSNKTSAGAWVFALATPSGVPLTGSSLTTGGDGQAWLASAIASLRPMGLMLQAGAAEGVDVQLRLAHAWSGGMNLHSHVVLQAVYPTPSGLQTRRYHGMATKLNWVNGAGEFMTTLNMGMTDALSAFAADLQRMCKGEA